MADAARGRRHHFLRTYIWIGSGIVLSAAVISAAILFSSRDWTRSDTSSPANGTPLSATTPWFIP